MDQSRDGTGPAGRDRIFASSSWSTIACSQALSLPETPSIRVIMCPSVFVGFFVSLASKTIRPARIGHKKSVRFHFWIKVSRTFCQARNENHEFFINIEKHFRRREAILHLFIHV
jgi:hypothetical protein